MEENVPASTKSMFLHAVRFGVIAAVVSFVIVVALYVIDLSSMATLNFVLFILLANAGIVCYAGINYRNTIGGYIPYGKAYVYCLAVFVVAGLTGLALQILLYHVID